MEPRRTQSATRPRLLTGFTLCVLLAMEPAAAIVIHVDPEVVVENGTTGVLRCTFKSSEVVTGGTSVSGGTSVTWLFQSSDPDSMFYKAPYNIFYFLAGRVYPGPEQFKDRLQFIGDINKRDVSIQLSPALFSDNGTYFCDVKNPPDIEGTQARTELRVVLKESLPQTNTAVMVGALCGVLVLLVLVAVVACVVMRVVHNRHDYEGAR